MMVLTFVLSQRFIVKLLTKPILLRIHLYCSFYLEHPPYVVWMFRTPPSLISYTNLFLYNIGENFNKCNKIIIVCHRS